MGHATRSGPPVGMVTAPWANLQHAPLPEAQPWGDRGQAFREVSYASPLGFRPLLLDLYLPAERPCPVVVWIHGGAYLMGSRSLVSPILERADLFHRLPSEGIAVASIDYRLSAEAHFPAQLHDVKAAVRWVRARAAEIGVSPGRIAVWGESAGGHLAAMATLTSGIEDLEGDIGPAGISSAVTTGVDWYGPTDFAAMDLDAPPDSVLVHDAPDSPESLLIGAPVLERPDLVARANPVTYARSGTPPLLIQHGRRDRYVPIGQSERLAAALQGSGADVTLIAVDDADHDFEGHADEARLVDTAIAFLRRHLLG